MLTVKDTIWHQETLLEQLTTYELLDLFTTYGTDSGGRFMHFLAVFSAYLVAGYVLAGKIKRMTLILLSVLLILVTSMTAIGQYMVQLVAIDIAYSRAAKAKSDKAMNREVG